MNVKDLGNHYVKTGKDENTGNPTPRHVSKKSTDFRLNLLNLGKTVDKPYLDSYRNTERPSSRLKIVFFMNNSRIRKVDQPKI